MRISCGRCMWEDVQVGMGKKDHKVVGLWPRSSLHVRKTLEHPRWEDFVFERLEEPETLNWLGNGWTEADKKKGGVSYYLGEVDFPPVAPAKLEGDAAQFEYQDFALSTLKR